MDRDWTAQPGPARPCSGTTARPARLQVMNARHTIAASACLAIALHLAGCEQRPQPPASEAGLKAGGDEPAAAPASPATPTTASSSPETATVAPAAAATPERALLEWAAAIERRDWPAVRGLWGNHGDDSGLTVAAFAARWDKLAKPRVTVGRGSQEGAAGSLYYSAPVRIVDGQRIIAGEVTIRRVNDVDGATREQLRWHFDPGTREPWSTAG